MGHSCERRDHQDASGRPGRLRGQPMADKSPKKPTNKKVGKSLKEKRADKNAKKSDKKY